MASSPNTIVSYPDAAQPLDGTEAYAAWQNGGQKQVTGYQLAQFLLDGIGTPTEASAVAADLSQQLAAMSAGQAQVAAAIQNSLPSSVAAGGTLPYEVTGISGGIGTGTGGTPGEYALDVTGGPSGHQAFVMIGADGKVASYRNANPGISTSNAAPVYSFNVPGLTGATVPTATIGAIPNGRVFSAPSADGTVVLGWGNNAGILSSAPFGGTQLSIYLKGSIDGFISGGNFGDVHTKISDTSGTGFAWSGRDALSQQPATTIDLTNSANYQILSTSTTNLATRYTVSVASGNLQIAIVSGAPLIAGPADTTKPSLGRVVRGAAKATVSNSIIQAMVGLQFTTVAPVPGAAIAAMDSGTVIIGLRGNGTTVAYTPTGTAASGVTIAGSSSTPFNVGDTVTMQFQPTSSTAGTFTVFINGSVAQTFTVTGLPANPYVGLACRLFTAGDTYQYSQIKTFAPSLDLTKRTYLDPNNAGTPIGTEANPWTSLADVVQDYTIDTSRRDLELTLKGGIYRGQIVMPSRLWRNIRIRSSQGQKCQIYASEQVTSGWTQVTGTNIWYQPHKFGTALNTNIPGGGLIDVSAGASQAMGRTGSYTVPWKLYQRLGPNTAFTDALVVPGSMWMITSAQTNGAQTIPAASVLVRAWGDADPNTLTFERSLYNAAIDITFGTDTDWNDCQVDLAGIEVRYAYVKGVNIERARARLLNMIARATSVGYGLQLNQCDAFVDWCFSEGCAGDGLNMAGGGFANGTSPAWPGGPAPSVTIRNSDFFGFVNLPNIVGDCISNHSGQYLAIESTRMKAGGKCGLAAVDHFRMTDSYAEDCWDTGVELLLGNNASATAEISGGRIVGCNRGIALDVGTSTGVTGVINARDVWLEDNVSSSINTFTSAAQPIVVNARDCRTYGAVPANGHVKTNGGTINVITSAALA